MITIKRKIHNHLNVIDTVYKNKKLQFEQSNLNSHNRYGSKQFKIYSYESNNSYKFNSSLVGGYNSYIV